MQVANRKHMASDAGRQLGILGGGQLGMFLCRAARSLGVRTTVLAPPRHESARHAADACICAPLDDPAAVGRLIQSCDVITFEIEAVPEVTLSLLARAEAAGEVLVHPKLATLKLLKDKGDQKDWMVREALPTLPHTLLDPGEQSAESLLAALEPPLVQKARQGGYDGKGVQMIATRAELAGLWPVPSVLEPMLGDCREVAVIVARGADGSLSAYPPVSMGFDDRFNAVHSVTCPAAIPDSLRSECERIARRCVDRLGAVGVFAVELFVDERDQVYINEISPRVHNSGHLTLEAFEASQFEQHVRAVMGMPLAPVVKRSGAAVMLNILYDNQWHGHCPEQPLSSCDDTGAQATRHWYGKSRGVAGRKMGHVTALGEGVGTATARALAAVTRLRTPRQERTGTTGA